ncbi:hypothetical protein MHB85_23635 [Paenibacillus sp. FSL K6-4396]|uniref:hypothetical protein n=1 Tax=unclassified Paenibacillus TaxID=185978 RepID=UPI00178535BA|nr:hypothetical protein [Paenibacillus sp. CFBP 13594]MBD8839079.1 hypothetical protein [Paenibacillus sp. CFBP 13594]
MALDTIVQECGAERFLEELGNKLITGTYHIAPSLQDGKNFRIRMGRFVHSINIKHIGNVNVKGELLKSVKSLFRSTKDKDVKAGQQLTYDLF